MTAAQDLTDYAGVQLTDAATVDLQALFPLGLSLESQSSRFLLAASDRSGTFISRNRSAVFTASNRSGSE